MCEGEVVCDFLAKSIPDLIQVLRFEKCHGGPFLDPLLVEGMIVEGENRLHVLPLTMCGNNPRISFFLWTCDQLVDYTVSFCFSQGLACQGCLRLPVWLSGPDAVKPVLYSKMYVKDALYDVDDLGAHLER